MAVDQDVAEQPKSFSVWRFVFVLTALLCASMAQAASLSPVSRIEIESLLLKLKTSGCTFNRNGTWYSSEEAQAHLTRKLNYLVEKDAVASTEQFIEMAASQSSMSGQNYLVKCGSKPSAPSGKWLLTQLQEMRAASSSPVK